jgi:hypothetical protein
VADDYAGCSCRGVTKRHPTELPHLTLKRRPSPHPDFGTFRLRLLPDARVHRQHARSASQLNRHQPGRAQAYPATAHSALTRRFRFPRRRVFVVNRHLFSFGSGAVFHWPQSCPAICTGSHAPRSNLTPTRAFFLELSSTAGIVRTDCRSSPKIIWNCVEYTRCGLLFGEVSPGANRFASGRGSCK